MKNAILKDSIYWVGVVDYNLRNFHHYSRSPLGSTYNAYLIKDEKIVLFDTVSSKYYKEFLNQIEKYTDPTKIDYIVCQHLEKDHSGALARIVELCKPEKIFCSTLGEKSMKGQFDTTGWPIHIVKDGDRINIGKRNITFLETRMLHWPDSMISYIEEDKILFTNDIFGQNIATSGHFADDFNKHILQEAVQDYYYNIVLPYSSLVTKLLDKVDLLGLEIDIIAPDHGLIFRTPEDIQFILKSYRDLALQKPKLYATITYDSIWAATEHMAYAIGEGLDSVNVPFTIINLQDNHCSAVMNALSYGSAIIVGSSTRNNMPLIDTIGLMANMKGLKPKNLIGAAFGSYGWSGEAPAMISQELANIGVQIVSEPVRVLYEPTKKDFEDCVALGKTVGEALIALVKNS